MSEYRKLLLARHGDSEGEDGREHEHHDRTLCRGSDCDDTPNAPTGDEDCDG